MSQVRFIILCFLIRLKVSKVLKNMKESRITISSNFVKVNKIYRHIANQRLNHQHKIST